MQTGVRSARWLSLLFVIGIVVTCFTPTMTAQNPPLNYFRDYFVTGDYVVGGVGLRGLGNNTGYAPGTIHIPDVAQNASDPGVPAGADIVAAFLYWQTVEKSKSAFAGQTGFFNGHAIIGVTLGNPNAPVSWSSGGCAGSSNGTTTLRTYRADVRPFLNVVNGVIQGNGDYPVRLTDSGSNGGGAPLTLGATLVLIYRMPRLPLTAVSLYDGAYAPGNGSQVTSHTIQGFYEPTFAAPVAKMTQIVGNGQPNKFETVAFGGPNVAAPLPSLYAPLPPFPGFYNTSWDNPTWTNLNQYTPTNSPALVRENLDTETTVIAPTSSNSGCVSWSAVIFSTPVQDTDKDGLLDKWETNHGYTDPKNETVSLPDGYPGIQDIYVQMDYLASHDFITSGGTKGHSHILKKDALDMVGKMFSDQGIKLHVDCADCYAGDPYVIHSSTTGGSMIDENTVICSDHVNPTSYCAFPGVPAIGWKGAFTFWRNQPLNYPNELQCVQNPGTCVRRFQHARKDSYHEVIFGHALALATTFWTRSDGSLSPIVVTGNNPVNGVVASGTATVTTSTANGLSKGDRVTISGAISPASDVPVFGKQFALNGTYLVAKILSGNSFTVSVSNTPIGTYDTPGLYVSTGAARSTSGWSDQRGADTLVTLGLWRSDVPADDQVGSTLVQAGTFAHELGHTLGLSHGGADGDNCKSNFQSVMNYLFQTRGLISFTDGAAHVDYSEQALPLLNENLLDEPSGIGAAASTYKTRWYAPLNNSFIDQALSAAGGRAASRHCDGTPITDGAKMVRLEGPVSAGSIDWNNDGDSTDTGVKQDISFNGTVDSAIAGSDDWDKVGTYDWTYLDLQQIGARRGVFGFSGDIWGTLNDGAGGSLNDGAGGSLNDGSGGSLNDGSGGSLNDGAGGSLNDGSGGSLNDGAGGSLNDGAGGSESDFNAANTTVDPASGLTGAVTKKNITLNWTSPGFGQIRTYYIWRADISKVPMSATNPPINIGTTGGATTHVSAPTTFPDGTIKGGATYIYFVSGALGNDSGVNTGNQSGASNMIKCDVNAGTCVLFP